MKPTSDVFKTIAIPIEEVLHKEKKSKFYGYAFPVQNEDEIKSILEKLHKKHHTANHVCYAWQLGTFNPRYRANDDGEPNNSAGLPIYGQIQSYDVTNVLVAVARIFGGTKLGVGGLISAYKTTAQLTLENAPIIEKIIKVNFRLLFDYQLMDKVMRLIKQHQLEIISQKMEMNCEIIVSVRKNDANKLENILSGIYEIDFKKN